MKSPTFSIGQKVKIKPHRIGKCNQYCSVFRKDLSFYTGKVMTISQKINSISGGYYRLENNDWNWTSCMLEKVEEQKGIEKLKIVRKIGFTDDFNELLNKIDELVDTVNKLTADIVEVKKEKEVGGYTFNKMRWSEIQKKALADEFEVTHDRVVEKCKHMDSSGTFYSYYNPPFHDDYKFCPLCGEAL